MPRKPHIIVISTADPSVIAASTTCPSPVVFAWSNAASIPKARNIPPPPKSPTMLIGGVGFSPLRPNAWSAPEIAI